MNGFRIILLTTALIFGLALSGIAAESNKSQGNPQSPATTTAPHIIKLVPGVTTINSLAGRPDTDLVELSNGKQLKIGAIRRLSAVQQRMRAAVPGSKMPAALKMKPDAGNIKMKIATAQDIGVALKRPDSDTVQLPNGKLATVGQIKFIQPYVERKLGCKLADLKRPNLTGPAIKIDVNTNWDALLKKPDNTILESPHGKRITVGEAKRYLAKNPMALPVVPKKSTSTPTVKHRKELKGGAK